MIAELRRIVGSAGVLEGSPAPYDGDATAATLGLRGTARATVLPGDAEELAGVVRWCYRHDVPMVPRGGGTGFAGGALPTPGSVVVSLERLTRIDEIEPACWRGRAQAGVLTATVARRAREAGLLFPPNPGAAEQSQLGGNIATNAGGPRAFKYGVTRHWVTGLEVVVAPGEVLHTGGATRKDVTGYDLVGLFCGSEGTLGIVTSAWLRFVPAPERSAQLAGIYASADEGIAAIAALMTCGIVPAAIEFADGGTLEASRGAFPVPVPAQGTFLVLAEVDGDSAAVDAAVGEVTQALQPGARMTHAAVTREELAALTRWRDGLSAAVTGVLGGKFSDDVAVPVDRLGDMLVAAARIAAGHGLRTCSWGHAGDGNLHVSFLVPAGDGAARDAAQHASHELHEAAVALGGAVSGEHGIGVVKTGDLRLQLGEPGRRVHAAVKSALDPKGLFNPGKKA